ncbi:hypothetical protein V8G54_021174 [Vigna mungo]|uniref:Uncharacterized protein n=1 Tax=Vigna mungo TaxID=3915 RepID=A0AAQ3NFN7_VIGMU
MEPPTGFCASLGSFFRFLPYFIGLLLLGNIKGILFCPLICVIIATGDTAIILALWIVHAVWTYYCVLRAKQLGPLLKIVICLCVLPVLLVLCPVFGILGSIIGGAAYGFLSPIFATFEAVEEGKDDKLYHCFIDGTWSTVEKACMVVRDVKDVAFHSYFSVMDDLLQRGPPNAKYYEIRFTRLSILFILMSLCCLTWKATGSKPGNNLCTFWGVRLHTATLLDPTQLETISTHWLKLHFFLFNCLCRLLYIPGALIAAVIGIVVDVPIISFVALCKGPYMLFKGWHRLFHDLIGREGPFLETICVPLAGLAILLWPLAVGGAVLASILASFFLGAYAGIIAYQVSPHIFSLLRSTPTCGGKARNHKWSGDIHQFYSITHRRKESKRKGIDVVRVPDKASDGGWSHRWRLLLVHAIVNAAEVVVLCNEED